MCPFKDIQSGTNELLLFSNCNDNYHVLKVTLCNSAIKLFSYRLNYFNFFQWHSNSLLDFNMFLISSMQLLVCLTFTTNSVMLCNWATELYIPSPAVVVVSVVNAAFKMDQSGTQVGGSYNYSQVKHLWSMKKHQYSFKCLLQQKVCTHISR